MRVVIVGGGFGGVKAALELSKRQIGKITLISDEPYFLHHATLYATATGKSYAESVIPLNVIFKNHPNVEVIEDTITAIHPERRLISSNKRDYSYDKLVLALGSVTSHQGITGLKKHSYGISTLDDIRKFQDHIQDEVISQKLDKDYFVIGAGQTGVELAAALNTYLKSLKSLYRLKNTASKVVLVEADARILPRLSHTASKKVEKELRKQGVSVRIGQKVHAVDDDSITIAGKDLATSTPIWTSGIVVNPFYKQNAEHFSLSSTGHVNVNPYLEAMPHVYVIGDNNTVKYSGRAFPAMHQARHVAKNITRLATRRPQVAFRPKSYPTSIPVGESYGYVEWAGLYVAGSVGSLVRRLIELQSYRQILPLNTAISTWRAHDVHHVEDDI